MDKLQVKYVLLFIFEKNAQKRRKRLVKIPASVWKFVGSFRCG
jgi:hypothetical protein